MSKSFRGAFLTALLTVCCAGSATAQIVGAQSATSGSVGALRRMIDSTAAGKPDYAAMTPKAQAATRTQLTQLKSSFGDLGSLQALRRVETGGAGGDVYEVIFVNGMAKLSVAMAPDGKVDGWGMSDVMNGRGPGEHH
jgi:hypothetical protein